MLSRSHFLGAGLVIGIFGAASLGSGGCSDATANCDEFGNNCMVCDGYGCHPANQGSSTTGPGSGSGGESQSASSGSGQGGSGGQPVCDPNNAACPCGPGDMCTGKTQCIGGICIVGCNFSYECGAGAVCADGKCVPGCDAQSPCTTKGTICENGICVPDPNNPACTDMKPCEVPTQKCENGVCVAGCSVNADCAMDEICDGATGSCIPDPSPKPGCDAAKMCTGQQQCGMDGYCHYPCNSETECQLIDNRFVACDMNICKTDAEVNPECSLANPCPQGMSCISNKCL